MIWRLKAWRSYRNTGGFTAWQHGGFFEANSTSVIVCGAVTCTHLATLYSGIEDTPLHKNNSFEFTSGYYQGLATFVHSQRVREQTTLDYFHHGK